LARARELEEEEELSERTPPDGLTWWQRNDLFNQTDDCRLYTINQDGRQETLTDQFIEDRKMPARPKKKRHLVHYNLPRDPQRLEPGMFEAKESAVGMNKKGDFLEVLNRKM
jgi:hypothetical protein